MLNEIVVTSPNKDYTEQEVRDGFVKFLKDIEQGKLVEVVRCINCRFCRPGFRCEKERPSTAPNDFCSYGRRE